MITNTAAIDAATRNLIDLRTRYERLLAQSDHLNLDSMTVTIRQAEAKLIHTCINSYAQAERLERSAG